MKRVTQKKGKAEFGAKFVCARGKRKALALREMELLSELDNERILYFHDAFEKKNVVVLITELYPSTAFETSVENESNPLILVPGTPGGWKEADHRFSLLTHRR